MNQLSQLYKERDRAKRDMHATEPGQKYLKLERLITELGEVLGIKEQKLKQFDKAVAAATTAPINGTPPQKRARGSKGTKAAKADTFDLPPALLQLEEPKKGTIRDLQQFRVWRLLMLMKTLAELELPRSSANIIEGSRKAGWLKKGRGGSGALTGLSRYGWAKRTKDGTWAVTAKGIDLLDAARE